MSSYAYALDDLLSVCIHDEWLIVSKSMDHTRSDLVGGHGGAARLFICSSINTVYRLLLNSLLMSALVILQKDFDSLLFVTETSHVDRGVSKCGLYLQRAMIEEQLDHFLVALVSGPV